jgi:hypothetical protein
MNYPWIPAVTNQQDGCMFHRIYMPFQYLYQGWDLSEINKKSANKHLETAKLFTFNRFPNLNIPDSELFVLARQYGFKIVIDIDDWVYLPEGHLLKKNWDRMKVGDRLVQLLKRADAITTTTQRLADKFKEINKKVYVIPNAVPFDNDFPESKQFLPGVRVSDRTRFGYVGGVTHLQDLKLISRVFDRMGPNWDFSLCGYNPISANIWDSMERIASWNGHNPNYKRVLTKNLDEYMTSYDELDCVLVPLVKSDWSACKSSLKCYEAGAKKCAAIVSDCAPYTDDVPRSVVTYCTSNRDWWDAAKKHKDLSFCRDQGEKLYEWVKENRNIKKVAQLRREIYDEIVYGAGGRMPIIKHRPPLKMAV